MIAADLCDGVSCGCSATSYCDARFVRPASASSVIGGTAATGALDGAAVPGPAARHAAPTSNDNRPGAVNPRAAHRPGDVGQTEG